MNASTILRQVQVAVRRMRPVPWGSNEWEWRRALAEAARAVPHDGAAYLVSTSFAVDIVFWMTKPGIGRADLDNLAKPVLDTLFLPRYAQVKDRTRTGALFRVDDDRVFKLTLQKRPVNSIADEGATITVSWGEGPP